MKKLKTVLGRPTPYLMLTAMAGAVIFGVLFYLFFVGLCFSFAIDKSYQVANHFLAISHALFAIISTLLMIRKKIKESTWAYLFAFTQGYLIFDMAATFYMLKIFESSAKKHTVLMLIHHGALFSLSFYTHFRPFFKQGLLSEITIPFLSTALAIRVLKPHYAQSIFFYILIAIIVLLYFIFRICNFTHILYRSTLFFYKKEKKHALRLKTLYMSLAFLLFLTITAINYYWFYKLLEGIFLVIKN